MTTRYIVLLRAINVGKRQAPMADLRAACTVAGFGEVRSYIASGNLLLTSDASATEVESAVEAIVARDFGFHADAMVRSLEQWRGYIASAPLPEARRERAKYVHLCVTKRPPAADAAERIMANAGLGEQAIRVGDALWIDFADGVGTSKLTPTLLDRAAGSPLTMRNWNTVVKLGALAAEGE